MNKNVKRQIGMTILKLLNIGLLFTAIAALSVNDSSNDSVYVAVNYRLPNNVVPIYYNIKLVPYIEENNFTFDGESNINITILYATQNLSLHILELTIDKAMTLLFDNDGIIYMPATYNYDNITQILVINFDNELSPGNYTLKMRYVGILNDDLNGFFRTSYINEEGNTVWLVASHFEATSARRAFPCWDEPALKATFDISIKHHRNYTALSNMPIREQSDINEDGTMWTHFDRTPPMSTYLVAFVVADYVHVPNEDKTGSIWCRSKVAPNTKFAQKVAQKSRQLLTEYTNSTDKVPKMDHVAIPQFAAGAMENWGLIIYIEQFLIYDKKVDTISTKQNVAKVAAHEMAHQWFGNVVSPLWWSHIWLNEGFASFFEKYILNQIFEDWRIMEYFVVTTQQSALHNDLAKNMKPITLEVNSPEEIESLFSYSSYGKAPAILRMLQHIITEEIFQMGISKYLHTYQFSSATSDDLWNALQTILDESDIPHTYKIKEVMDTWIKQRHFPVVYVTRKNDTNEIILTQEHFRPEYKNKHIDDDKWWIPLTFATQTKPNFSNTLPTYWLRPQDQNITINGIDSNDWIIVNLQQMGYYRVNYDSSIWQKIANYLNSDNYTKIHVLNRAQIIDDAYHLMMANQLNIRIFLDVISYLSQETDFIAWYPMFEILENMEIFYKFPETEFFKSYMLEILDGLIKNVGYKEDPDEDDLTKLKRTKALKWACTFGHSECKRMATVKLNEHFADPKKNKVSPNLREWTYCNGLMEANASTWNKLLYIYIHKSNKEALKYLACSENSDIINNFLNISTLNNLIMQDKDYDIIYSSIIKKHANNNVIVNYILANLEKISRKYDMDNVLNDIIDNVYSNEQLDEISKFVKNKFRKKIFKDVQGKIKNRKIELLDLLELFASFRPVQ